MWSLIICLSSAVNVPFAMQRLYTSFSDRKSLTVPLSFQRYLAIFLTRSFLSPDINSPPMFIARIKSISFSIFTNLSLCFLRKDFRASFLSASETEASVSIFNRFFRTLISSSRFNTSKRVSNVWIRS